jgi:hypothetical protein
MKKITVALITIVLLLLAQLPQTVWAGAQAQTVPTAPPGTPGVGTGAQHGEIVLTLTAAALPPPLSTQMIPGDTGEGFNPIEWICAGVLLLVILFIIGRILFNRRQVPKHNSHDQ